MKIIDDILQTLNYDTTVKDIRQGPFQTAVLTRCCGLASTPHEPGPHHSRNPVSETGLLLNKDTPELARLALSESSLEAAIGMATINSLLEVDEQLCSELNAGDFLAERGKNKKIAIVGHFPFIPNLRSIAGEVWVIERNPAPDDLPEEAAENFIPQADIVAITGTAFTNHTIEHLLSLCAPGACVLVLGGTTPLSPVLFDYGVNVLAGARIIDPEKALLCVSQGATYRQIKGIRHLTMERQ